MRESDIYIQPSLQEGFCNAVLEAQANGLLCIVSDAEGLPENVVHGVTGWVVPRADAESLADMIISASELSCSEKEQVGRAAAERVQREFSLEEQRCKFVRFFEN
jgi:colanic acid/amylovoran biosynthesis glycosyltransferase